MNISGFASIYLFLDARGSRVAWVMVSEMARWGTLISPWVGVSYLMSACFAYPKAPFRLSRPVYDYSTLYSAARKHINA